MITPAWQVSTGDGDRSSVWVRVTVRKPVWSTGNGHGYEAGFVEG